VRQAEALAHDEGVPERKPQKPRSAGGGKVKDADTLALEKQVSDALGLKVSIDHRETGGSVTIRYRDLDQLDGIVQKLAKG
jgi:ParB family chromosome partitioning protein